MNEQLWLSGSPHQMLSVLRRLSTRLRRPVDKRKLRFFALYCCRLAWPALIDERSRQAVDVAERALVGMATPDELEFAVEEAAAARDDAIARCDSAHSTPLLGARIAALVVAWVVARGFDQGIIAKVRDALCFRSVLGNRDELLAFVASYGQALREVYGNPFRPVETEPEWLTSDVVALARGIYAECAFDRMPILADALQDAGCDNEDVLSHCRDAKQVHVRGCWVLDLVLGKG